MIHVKNNNNNTKRIIFHLIERVTLFMLTLKIEYKIWQKTRFNLSFDPKILLSYIYRTYDVGDGLFNRGFIRLSREILPHFYHIIYV